MAQYQTMSDIIITTLVFPGIVRKQKYILLLTKLVTDKQKIIKKRSSGVL